MHSFYHDDVKRWSKKDIASLLICKNALSELNEADALDIVSLMYAKRIAAGTVITQEGMNSTDYMILVLSGQATIASDSTRKNESVTLAIATTGSLIGEMGLLDGEPRSATCTSVSDMYVAVLERNALTSLLQQKPTLAASLLTAILKRVSAHLRTSNRKLRAMDAINRSLQQELQAYTMGQESRTD